MVKGRCYIQLVTVLPLLLLHHNFLLVLCGSFRKFPTVLMWAPPQAMVWISSPTWSSPQAIWEHPGMPRAHLPLPLFLTSVFILLFFGFFPSFLCMSGVFRKVLPTWLLSWAVSCHGAFAEPAGAVWGQHGQLLQPTFLAVKTWTSTSDTRG